MKDEASKQLFGSLVIEGKNRLLTLSELSANILNISGENLNLPVAANNLAYVIYTSATTGEAKGVCIEHSSLMNYCENLVKLTCDLVGDNSLLHSSIAFDLQNTAIFPTLLLGKNLHISHHSHSLEAIDYYLSQNINFNFIKITPSHLSYIVDIPEAKLHAAVSMFIVGGEQFSTELYLQAIKKFPHSRFVNHYGPTETTIGCCIWEINDTVDLSLSKNIPIGKPINNVFVFIVNDKSSSDEGELYIGGDCLARGYLDDWDKTNEKFSLWDEKLIYKTGDHVKLREDNLLEFIARCDDQVKVRGYRIELNAIVETMRSHGDVNDAIAFVSNHRGNDILGMAVSYGNFSLIEEDLKIYLKERLPEYMCPNNLLIVPSLPITRNGKTDYKLVKKWYVDRFLKDNVDEPPRTAIEKSIADIWISVLAIENISRNANFFTLGGHSLLAAKVTHEVARLFKVNIEIKHVLQYPLLNEYSDFINGLRHTVPLDKTDLYIEQIIDEIVPEYYPMSSVQKELWFIAQYSIEGSVAYNMPCIFKITGNMKVDILQKSVNNVITRHEILRTSFHYIDGEYLQKISPSHKISVKQYFVEHENLLNKMTEEIQTVFDVSSLPLLRVKIYSVTEQEHYFLLIQHHIISDYYSEQRLLAEIGREYNAQCEGCSSPTPLKIAQYRHFVETQLNFIKSTEFPLHLNYWLEKLKGASRVNLPGDKKPLASSAYAGDVVEVSIGKNTLTSLQQFSQDNQCTLFGMLLTGYFILLHRYTQDEDICIGVPVQITTNLSPAPSQGLFINTIVSRQKIDESDTFIETMKKVTSDIFEAMNYCNVPLGNIPEKIEINQCNSPFSIFQVAFVLENSTITDLFTLTGASVETWCCPQKSAKFDLSLRCVESDEGLVCYFEYKTDLFTKEAIQKFANHYCQILENTVRAGDQPICNISMLSSSEREALINTFNNVSRDIDIDQGSVLNWFQKQVEEFPGKVALVDTNIIFTYKQLWERVEQFCDILLRKHNIKSGDKIATYLDRSAHLVVSFLAILRMRCVYIPLDPEQPNNRINMMLNTCGNPIILSNKELAPHLISGCKFIFVEEFGVESPCDKILSALDAITLRKVHGIEEIDASYIIFTSGTTGKHKGVISTRQGLLNRMLWSIQHYQVDEKVCFLATAAVGFDIAVWEMLLPLMAGGTLVIAKPAGHKDLDYLYNEIEKHSINMLHMVPSLLEIFLQSENSRKLCSLQKVVTGGEKLSQLTVEKFFSTTEGKLYHAYGPSEASISVTHWDCENIFHQDRVMLGTPIANTQIYLVDKYNNLTPPGVAGELCIAGVALAAGYLENPEATAKSFVLNPFHMSSKQKHSTPIMYKTGDLARWSSSGELEFLGRCDGQLKINGHRIEPEEIEITMSQYPEIEKAVIKCVENGGQKHLIAYVKMSVHQSNTKRLSGEIRSYLMECLPEYMIPYEIIFIDEFKITPNGKLDFRALPDPRTTLSTRISSYVKPSSNHEIKIAEIWEECLQIEKVSIDENFFSVGGNSLLAIKLIYLLKRKSFDVKVIDIFTYPTIKRLSHYLSGSERKDNLQVEKIDVSLRKKNMLNRQSRVDNTVEGLL